MSKWAMRAHFRHLSFNNFLMILITLQGDGFWPLQSRFENLGVHLGFQLPILEFTWECEGSCPHTLCIPRSMWCESRVSLLARNLATLCLGHKPKARVATSQDTMFMNNILNLPQHSCHNGLHCFLFIIVLLKIPQTFGPFWNDLDIPIFNYLWHLSILNIDDLINKKTMITMIPITSYLCSVTQKNKDIKKVSI
jgi:hypothetical protein